MPCIKTKGFTFPQELIPGLASGEITMVAMPVKQLAGFQDAKSVHPDGSGNGWIAWSGNTSAKETKRLYPGKQGFMPPLTVGDTLAVKETFRYAFDYIIFDCLQYKIDKHCKKPKNLDEKTGYIFEENCNNSDGKWKSPITMPLWACRIHRPVTGVKVVRELEGKCDGSRRSRTGGWRNKSTHKFPTAVRQKDYVRIVIDTRQIAVYACILHNWLLSG
jgi:hypothetical protein